jgi:hypothetical protein
MVSGNSFCLTNPHIPLCQDKLNDGLRTKGGRLKERQCLQAATAAWQIYQEHQHDHGSGLQVEEADQRHPQTAELNPVSLLCGPTINGTADAGDYFWAQFIDPHFDILLA